MAGSVNPELRDAPAELKQELKRGDMSLGKDKPPVDLWEQQKAFAKRMGLDGACIPVTVSPRGYRVDDKKKGKAE